MNHINTFYDKVNTTKMTDIGQSFKEIEKFVRVYMFGKNETDPIGIGLFVKNAAVFGDPTLQTD